MSMLKLFPRSYFGTLALLLAAYWYPCTAYGKEEGATVDVEFSLQKTQEGVPVGITRTDAHPWLYHLEQLSEGQWTSYKGKSGLTVKPDESGQRLIGEAKLPPGKYKIVNLGSIQYPSRCTTKFSISAGRTNPLTVIVPHYLRKRLKGKIRLNEKGSGKPLEGVSLHLASEGSAIGVLRRWGDQDFIQPTDKVTTSEAGIAEFWFWADSEALKFIIKDYRFSKFGSEIRRVFPSAELVNGITWAIQERPIKAKLRVYLQTRDAADIQLSETAITSLFPKDKGAEFWHLPIFEYEMGRDINFDYRLAVDVGEFIAEENAFVYRNLKDEQTYMVGEALELFQSRLPLVEESKTKFKVEAGHVIVLKVVVVGQRTSTENQQRKALLKGKVADKTGEPIRAVAVRLHGTAGTFTIRSNKRGEFSKALEAGSYNVALFKRGYEPWSKRVELPPAEERELRIEMRRLQDLVVNIAGEEGKRSRGGQLFVYAAGAKGLLAHTNISADGIARIKGVTPGKKLVVFRGHAKANEHGVASGEFLIGTKEVNIKEGKDTHFDLKVHDGLVVDVALAKNRPALDEVALLLWYDWEGEKILMGAGRWVKREPTLSKVYIPHTGKYTVEILVSEGQKEYENRRAYWGNTIMIGTETRSVRIAIDKDTKHEFIYSPIDQTNRSD